MTRPLGVGGRLHLPITFEHYLKRKNRSRTAAGRCEKREPRAFVVVGDVLAAILELDRRADR